MTESNVEIIRRAMQRVTEQGVEAAVAELYAEEAVMYGVEGWPEAGPWHGRSAILDEWRRIGEDFEQQEMLVEEVVARADWVVTRTRWRVRSRSGFPGEVASSLAARMRDGKVVEARFFWDFEDALTAAGIAK